MPIFSDDQDLIIRKLHPSQVVDEVVSLVSRIHVNMRVVFESEHFLFQYISIHFHLDFILAQQFEEDTVIPTQEAVDFDCGLFGGVTKVFMVVIFAIRRAKYFVGPSVDLFSAYFAILSHNF